MACNFEKKRPVVRGVILEGDDSTPFEHVCDGQQVREQQAVDVLRMVQGRLKTVSPSVVVVRTQDFHPGIRYKPQTVEEKAVMEGVLIAAAGSASSVSLVRHLSGQEIGKACGSTKEEAEDAAAERFGKDFREAGAAAMAASALASH